MRYSSAQRDTWQSNQSNKKIDDLSHKFVRATEELASNTTKISDLTTAQGAMATIIIDLKGALEKNTKEFTELKTQQSQLELLATTTQTGLTTLKQEVHQITTKLKEHVETQIKNIENQIKKERITTSSISNVSRLYLYIVKPGLPLIPHAPCP